MEQAATFAGVVVRAAALPLQLVERARQASAARRMRIAEALSAASNRPSVAARTNAEEASPPSQTFALKPGEEIAVQPGAVLPVDGTIVAGDALVYPWLGATESVRRREGD